MHSLLLSNKPNLPPTQNQSKSNPNPTQNPPTTHPPRTHPQVAVSILSAVARGEWVCSNLRMDVHLLQDLTLGLVPRTWLRLPWVMVRCFLGPIICWIIAAQFDAIARRHAATRYAGIWGAGGEGAGKKGGRPKRS